MTNEHLDPSRSETDAASTTMTTTEVNRTAAENGVSRRTVLRLGAAGATGVALGAAGGFGTPYLSQRGLLSADGAFAATSTALGDLLFYTEVFPTSPLILSPFTDKLPIPKALAPVQNGEYAGWAKPPGPGIGQQNSMRQRAPPDLVERTGLPRPDRLQDRPARAPALLHHLEGAADQLARHSRPCPSTSPARRSPPAPSGRCR